MALSDDILHFWFGDNPLSQADWWFNSSPEKDKEVKDAFESTLVEFDQKLPSDWLEHASTRLALILLFDQFPRQIYRDSAKAFEFDKKAQEICLQGVQRGHPEDLETEIHTWFYFMPLMHAEDLQLQKFSVLHYKKLLQRTQPRYRDAIQAALDHAVRHHDEIERFGRFPYRNQALDRQPTSEEMEYVQSLIKAMSKKRE